MKIRSKFSVLNSKLEAPKIQDEVIEFWKDQKVFEKSVDDRNNEEVVFYDGPPFPTGKPHHGTVLYKRYDSQILDNEGL